MNNIKEMVEILENKVRSRELQRSLIERKIGNLQEQLRELDNSNRKTQEQIQKLRSIKIPEKENLKNPTIEELQENPNWDSLPPSTQRSLIDGTMTIKELPDYTKQLLGVSSKS